MTNTTAGTKGNNYRKRYPKAEITNAAYKRLLARVDRILVREDISKARIEDLEEILEEQLAALRRRRVLDGANIR